MLTEVKKGGMWGAWGRSRKGTENFRYKFPSEETIYRTEGELKKKKDVNRRNFPSFLLLYCDEPNTTLQLLCPRFDLHATLEEQNVSESSVLVRLQQAEDFNSKGFSTYSSIWIASVSIEED